MRCMHLRQSRHAPCRTLVLGLCIVSAIARAGATPEASASDPTLVTTSYGPVRGTCDGALCRFLAVPYAAPPTGARRFAPPASPAAWASAIDATKPGAACWQTPEDDTTPQSEDCLRMDIYAPRGQAWGRGGRHEPPAPPPAAGGLPVIFFLYGGGMTSGACSMYPGLRKLALAERGRALVLCANYRLGPLGWLATSSLSHVDGSSGNYGLQDVLFALGWARDNVAAFGGDGEQITVMGQSSGATLGWMLLAHAAQTLHDSQGLTGPRFRRAVLLSGSPNISMSRSHAERQNAPFASSVGCAAADPASTVYCLRHNVTAQQLSCGHVPVNTTWQMYDALTWGLPDRAHTAGWPLPGISIVDGALLRQDLGATLRAYPLPGVDVLLGNCAQESDLSPRRDLSLLNGSALRATLRRAFAPWGAGLGSALLDQYAEELQRGGPQMAYTSLSADVGTACGQLQMLEAIASHKEASPNLHYTVLSDGPARKEGQRLGIANQAKYASHGAYHMMDLIWATEAWDWFANFSAPYGKHYTPLAADRQLSLTLRGIYSDFAHGRLSPSTVPAFRGGGTHNGSHSSYAVGAVHRGRVTRVDGWKQGVCAMLATAGVGGQFWWAN